MSVTGGFQVVDHTLTDPTIKTRGSKGTRSAATATPVSTIIGVPHLSCTDVRVVSSVVRNIRHKALLESVLVLYTCEEPAWNVLCYNL